jgi:hypothetical protein
MRTAGILVVLLLVAAPASAQWDAYWNASGPHPISCLFNGQEYYVGDDVCVGAGIKQICLGDGSLGVRTQDASCTGPEVARRSMTKAHGRSATACTFDASKFSVGAEICVGPGAKQICQADGALGQAQAEPSCRGQVIGAGG